MERTGFLSALICVQGHYVMHQLTQQPMLLSTSALYDSTMHLGSNYSAGIAQRELDAPMLDAIASKVCRKHRPSGYCFTYSC